MPKRTKKNRYMKKGGVIIGTPAPMQATTAQGYPTAPAATSSSVSTWFNGATTALKKAASLASTELQKTVSSSPIGGKRRRRGGEMLATPIPTAKPQVWVGGRTRKRTCQKRHKHTKSCKSQTYKKQGNRKKRSRKSKFPFSESLKRLIKM
jgi:hypothetical protein